MSKFSVLSEGSILVDYFVELTDIGQEVDTREIKQLFHEALQAQLPPVNTTSLSLADEGEDGWEDNGEVVAAAATDRKSSMKRLGNFIVDPSYTDFIGRNHHLQVFDFQSQLFDLNEVFVSFELA